MPKVAVALQARNRHLIGAQIAIQVLGRLALDLDLD
jgi:hypothetical protein